MRTRSERGSALLLVLVAVAVLGGLMVAGYAIVEQHAKETKVELELKGQTLAVAESGITETLSWFRRSLHQPVNVFDAQIYEAEPKPKVIPQGIVREFEVSRAAKLWGRYEVTPSEVEDVSAERGRGEKGSGIVWKIRSTGYVYVRIDAKKRFDEAPNRIAHRVTVETELQRMAVKPPVRAALVADRGDSVTVGRGGRIRGSNGAAIAYRQLTGRPAIDLRAEISADAGAPVAQAAHAANGGDYDLTELGVFGVRAGELATLADVAVASVDELPATLPQLGIVAIDGDAVFDEKHPLMGGGVLYVNGSLTIKARSNASFFGQIFVAGNLDMDSPAVLSGSVVVEGKTNLRGSGDVSEIAYNEDILNVVRQKLGQYRIRRTMTRVFDQANPEVTPTPKRRGPR